MGYDAIVELLVGKRYEVYSLILYLYSVYMINIVGNVVFFFSHFLSSCFDLALGFRHQPAFTKRCAGAVSGNGSADGGFEKDRIVRAPGDPTRREFTYFMLGGARFVYASAARLALVKVKIYYSLGFTQISQP